MPPEEESHEPVRPSFSSSVAVFDKMCEARFYVMIPVVMLIAFFILLPVLLVAILSGGVTFGLVLAIFIAEVMVVASIFMAAQETGFVSGLRLEIAPLALLFVLVTLLLFSGLSVSFSTIATDANAEDLANLWKPFYLGYIFLVFVPLTWILKGALGYEPKEMVEYAIWCIESRLSDSPSVSRWRERSSVSLRLAKMAILRKIRHVSYEAMEEDLRLHYLDIVGRAVLTSNDNGFFQSITAHLRKLAESDLESLIELRTHMGSLEVLCKEYDLDYDIVHARAGVMAAQPGDLITLGRWTLSRFLNIIITMAFGLLMVLVGVSI